MLALNVRFMAGPLDLLRRSSEPTGRVHKSLTSRSGDSTRHRSARLVWCPTEGVTKDHVRFPLNIKHKRVALELVAD